MNARSTQPLESKKTVGDEPILDSAPGTDAWGQPPISRYDFHYARGETGGWHMRVSLQKAPAKLRPRSSVLAPGMPNPETIAAIADADRGNLVTYESVDALFAELDQDD